MYEYSPENARLYKELGVVGTTYEVSFNEMSRLIGNLQGKTVLDFGTGAGRSALLLKSLGAERVIGVDHDRNMITEAKSQSIEGVEFHLMDKSIPLPDNSIDVVVSAHVFVEMASKDAMISACKEIARVTKLGDTLVVIATNPDSVGHEYVSYRYLPQNHLNSGGKITCVVRGSKEFEIQDTYWTIDDYHQVLEESGFKIEQTTYPLAEPNGWLDETRVAPDVVIKCVNQKTYNNI